MCPYVLRDIVQTSTSLQALRLESPRAVHAQHAAHGGPATYLAGTVFDDLLDSTLFGFERCFEAIEVNRLSGSEAR